MNIAQKTDCSFYLINIPDNVEIEHFLNFLLPYTLTLTFHAITRSTINIIESDLYVNLYYIPETCLTLTLLPIFELNIPSSNCLTAIWRSVTLTRRQLALQIPKGKVVLWRDACRSPKRQSQAQRTSAQCTRVYRVENPPSRKPLLSRSSSRDHREGTTGPLLIVTYGLRGFGTRADLMC